MKINNKKFRNTLVALAFGSLVTVVPASAASITVSAISTSSNPNAIAVGSYQFNFGGNSGLTAPVTSTPTGVIGFTDAQDLGSSNSFGSFSGYNVGPTGYTQSEVIDIKVSPTVAVNGGTAAATSVDFQGSIEDIGGNYELVFGQNGTQYCSDPASTACYGTSNGNVVSNGQKIINYNGVNYAEIVQNGVTYAIQATTDLQQGKGAWVNGVIGVSLAPEPSTYAMTGLAAAFLGLVFRRKAKRS